MDRLSAAATCHDTCIMCGALQTDVVCPACERYVSGFYKYMFMTVLQVFHEYYEVIVLHLDRIQNLERIILA
jgi:hypothetical protein